MGNDEKKANFDFSVNKKNLYREEAITDVKVASIRRLIPINLDGSEDKSRTTIFYGHTQLMSPDGPIPLQAPLQANNLEEAMDLFPEAMEKALAEVVDQFRKIQQERENSGQKEDSRIIMPGK